MQSLIKARKNVAYHFGEVFQHLEIFFKNVPSASRLFDVVAFKLSGTS